jgi:hypothetical protein
MSHSQRTWLRWTLGVLAFLVFIPGPMAALFWFSGMSANVLNLGMCAFLGLCLGLVPFGLSLLVISFVGESPDAFAPFHSFAGSNDDNSHVAVCVSAAAVCCAVACL